MPASVTLNGTAAQSAHDIPLPRPAFGQVQDTALQHETAVGVSQPRAQQLMSDISVDQPASVSSAGISTFQPTIARSSLENASELSPFPGASLSDGIPPAFETSSSCGGSASALAPTPGHRYNINLTTGRIAHPNLPSCRCHVASSQDMSHLGVRLSI